MKYEKNTKDAENMELRSEVSRLLMENKVLRSELERKNATLKKIEDALAEANPIFGAVMYTVKQSLMEFEKNGCNCVCGKK